MSRCKGSLIAGAVYLSIFDSRIEIIQYRPSFLEKKLAGERGDTEN
jgi:hypothetical protein